MRRSVPATRRPLEFGISVVAGPRGTTAVVDVARRAEDAGLAWLGVRDRPGEPRFLDTWTLLATLAPGTRRLGLYPEVADAPLPQPDVLAGAAATMQSLSAGRIALGVGAGWLWDAVHSYGGPRLSPGECVDAFEGALRRMRATWDGVGAAGTPELWCGTQGARMLRVAGRLADGWSASAAVLDDDGLTEGQRHLDEAARRAGRAPDAVRRVLTVSADLTGRARTRALVGRIAGWRERLGFDTFVLGPVEAREVPLLRWVEEVVPAVRERCADPVVAHPGQVAVTGASRVTSATARGTAVGT